jgi:hypothetical protein
MNIKRSILLATILTLAPTLAASAQDKGYWSASSATAHSITGDVGFSANKVTINFASFTIAQIRAMQPAEISAVFNDGTTAPGNLYALNIPAAKYFLHKNTICGSEDVHWMVTTITGKTMQIAFFSEPKLPIFTPEAMVNSTSLCGTFTYTR